MSYISERDETDLRLTVTVATTTEAAKQSIFAAGEERSDRDERGKSFLSLVVHKLQFNIINLYYLSKLAQLSTPSGIRVVLR